MYYCEFCLRPLADLYLKVDYITLRFTCLHCGYYSVLDEADDDLDAFLTVEALRAWAANNRGVPEDKVRPCPMVGRKEGCSCRKLQAEA